MEAQKCNRLRDVSKEAVEKNENTITEEIKAKVREVVEGALGLFIKDQRIVLSVTL